MTAYCQKSAATRIVLLLLVGFCVADAFAESPQSHGRSATGFSGQSGAGRTADLRGSSEQMPVYVHPVPPDARGTSREPLDIGPLEIRPLEVKALTIVKTQDELQH